MQTDLDTFKELVASSTSVMEVIEKMGRKKNGGTHSSIKQRIIKHGIDTSHFLGQASNRGKSSPFKMKAEDILVELPIGSYREKTKKLERALDEMLVPKICNTCGLGTIWYQNPIVLQIDHIDSNYLNNKIDNLQYLCPNCHSQKTKHGRMA